VFLFFSTLRNFLGNVRLRKFITLQPEKIAGFRAAGLTGVGLFT
jgi:hypothetical protein